MYSIVSITDPYNKVNIFMPIDFTMCILTLNAFEMHHLK